MKYNENKLKAEIDDFISSLITTLISRLKSSLESITIVGSFGVKRISLERPNVNIFIFLKKGIKANIILKIGYIIYKTAINYLKYFSVKVDSFPYRLGIPEGGKRLQLILSPRVLFMDEQKDFPPFGIACNILLGMKATRRVVWGSDPLKDINLKYSRKDFLRWAYFDIGELAKNMLVLTPISYNLMKNKDLIVIESIGYGKMALTWGIELFLKSKDLKKGGHIKLIKEKDKIVDFYKGIDKELCESAEIILDARNKVFEYKKSKSKTEKLFNASYNAINRVFKEVKRRIK
jgi:hypothetical protein